MTQLAIATGLRELALQQKRGDDHDALMDAAYLIEDLADALNPFVFSERWSMAEREKARTTLALARRA